MDWIFLIKTVFSFILILCGTWYLRRDEKERYEALKMQKTLKFDGKTFNQH